MSGSKDFSQGPCGCLNSPGTCLYTSFCPCLAFDEAATNVGDHNGCLYCLLTFPFYMGCCALACLGKSVADKKGIKMGLATSCVYATFDICLCYSCSVVNESHLMKDAPSSSQMERN